MDDIRVGSIIRALRRRRGLRQIDVAALAGVTQGVVSKVERGQLEFVCLRATRKIAAVVGVQLPFDPRWRGADLARLLDAAHAESVESVAAALRSAGWVVLPEVTFSHYGERGSIDLLAWRESDRTLLVVEVKTRLVDVQDLLAKLDMKCRLAPRIAREQMGWQPDHVARVLVVQESTVAREMVARHKATFDASFPARTVAVRQWIAGAANEAARSGALAFSGLWFLRRSTTGTAKKSRGGSSRVRRPRDAGA